MIEVSSPHTCFSPIAYPYLPHTNHAPHQRSQTGRRETASSGGLQDYVNAAPRDSPLSMSVAMSVAMPVEPSRPSRVRRRHVSRQRA